MQKLLDIIYKAIYNAEELKTNGLNHKGDIDIMLNVLNVYRVIIEKDMLEKEKISIADAYIKGKQDALDNIEKKGFEYFNETFNQ